VAKAAFVEGNSAPSRYTASAPRIVRPAAQWARIGAEVAHGARHLMSPYLRIDRKALAANPFLCL
jgi:hypothetical protein